MLIFLCKIVEMLRSSIFTINVYKNLISIAAFCFLFLSAANVDLYAQYKGAPVKKDRLIRALRSKQLQTEDIVTIINRNGVDFELTEETKKNLIAAGARPEVIQAVANNSRLSSSDNTAKKNRKSSADYDDLLEQALSSYKEKKNPRNAVSFLQTAVKTDPKNPAAYQMLGFVYLYGLNDLMLAENSMREAFKNGGSAVFRVYHDDNGNFKHRCTGSLYISKNNLRFESDDNVHTFETSTANIEKFKLDTESNNIWKKHSIFKVFLKFGKEDIKFRFAPLTGLTGESQMVARFIAASNSSISLSDLAATAKK